MESDRLYLHGAVISITDRLTRFIVFAPVGKLTNISFALPPCENPLETLAQGLLVDCKKFQIYPKGRK